MDEFVTKVKLQAAKATGNAAYDQAAKEIFELPGILAPLLKEVVTEYKNYSADEVYDFIVPDSIKSTPVDDQSVMLDVLPTEDSSVSEKLIRYDTRFRAKNPTMRDGEFLFSLIFDVEVQNDYKPRIEIKNGDGVNRSVEYPLIKRAIYYGARLISSQLGVLTETTNYGDLQKVYSIWICNENIPKALKGTVTQYNFSRKDIIGKCNEPEKDFDLMSIVMIRGGCDDDSNHNVLDYLKGVFEADFDKIAEYIPKKQDLDQIKKGVNKMRGLGQAIADKSFIAGEARGRSQERHAAIMKWLEANKDPELLSIFGYSKDEIEEVRKEMQQKK